MKDKEWIENNQGDGKQLEYYLEFLKSKNLKARDAHAGNLYTAISSLIPEGLGWQKIDLNLGLAEDLRKDFEVKMKDKEWIENNQGDGRQLEYYLEFLKSKNLKARGAHAGNLYSAISSLIPEGLGWQRIHLNLGLAEDLRKNFGTRSADAQWRQEHQGNLGQIKYYAEVIGASIKEMNAEALYSALSSLLDHELAMGEGLKRPAWQALDWKKMKQPMREILETAPYSSIVIPERGSLARSEMRAAGQPARAEMREEERPDVEYFKNKIAQPFGLSQNTQEELIRIMESSQEPYSAIAVGVLAWLASDPKLPGGMQAREVLWAISELENVPGIDRVLDHINIKNNSTISGFLTEIIFAYQKQRQGYVVLAMAAELLPNVEVDIVLLERGRSVVDSAGGIRQEKHKVILAESKHYPRNVEVEEWMKEEIEPKINKYWEAIQESKNHEFFLEHYKGQNEELFDFVQPSEFVFLISDSIRRSKGFRIPKKAAALKSCRFRDLPALTFLNIRHSRLFSFR